MNFFTKIKKYGLRWKKQRHLKEYYLSHSLIPRGENIFLFVILFSVISFIILWNAPDYQTALLYFVFSLLTLSFGWYSLNKRRYKLLVKEVHQKLIDQELEKRLGKASTEEVLEELKKSLSENFSVTDLERKENVLTGTYQGEKIQVYYYFLPEDEVMETKEILYVLRECRQKGVTQVRLFTNGNFSDKASFFGERYDLNLRLYNGKMLGYFFKNSTLYPSTTEIEDIIKKETGKRQRKIAVLRKQLLTKNKFNYYLVYGLTLMLTAWFKIGIVSLNWIFGSILLTLALFTLIAKQSDHKIIF